MVSYYQQCTNDCPSDVRALRYFETEDSDPIPELGFISEQPDDETDPDEEQYFFDQTAGENIPVYILDTGANIQHEVSDPSPLACSANDETMQSFTSVDNIASVVRWISVFTDEDGLTSQDDSGLPRGNMGTGPQGEGGSHGTRMLDMVTGARGGTSRRALPIVCELLLC